ncbi:hypothetical protein AGR3A_Lc180145 [Agrobacterium tomkonis CFBP 6623]|uniref:Uncharacterized protein n=1 Tax=Agrobacterium tomkonis CFBP 6623 TaxID=1183432 RepID=A0A1S7S386_9HYPH|nr:hypothetical protein AGR3A_Lc180145 [Agrobacterium tomkonis CFBP 6623]
MRSRNVRVTTRAMRVSSKSLNGRSIETRPPRILTQKAGSELKTPAFVAEHPLSEVKNDDFARSSPRISSATGS